MRVRKETSWLTKRRGLRRANLLQTSPTIVSIPAPPTDDGPSAIKQGHNMKLKPNGELPGVAPNGRMDFAIDKYTLSGKFLRVFSNANISRSSESITSRLPMKRPAQRIFGTFQKGGLVRQVRKRTNPLHYTRSATR